MTIEDVEAAGGITRATRLMEQEALRAEAAELSVQYGIPVYPARRRGEDGFSAEVEGVIVSGGTAEVRQWLEQHATPVHKLAMRGVGSGYGRHRTGKCLCGWKSGPLSGDAVQEAYDAHLFQAPAGEASSPASSAGQDSAGDA